MHILRDFSVNSQKHQIHLSSSAKPFLDVSSPQDLESSPASTLLQLLFLPCFGTLMTTGILMSQAKAARTAGKIGVVSGILKEKLSFVCVGFFYRIIQETLRSENWSTPVQDTCVGDGPNTNLACPPADDVDLTRASFLLSFAEELQLVT